MNFPSFASLVNWVICGAFLLFGIFYPPQLVPLYYVTLLELFIKFELFVLIASVLMMAIGELFGERIQPNTEWKCRVILCEVMETAKCVFVVSGLSTFLPIILFCFPSFPLVHKMYLPLQLGLILLFGLLNIYLHCGYSLYLVEVTLPYLYINTSVHHNIHHEKTNTNLGEVSPFWDYIFGTYHRERYLENKSKFGWRFCDFSFLHDQFMQKPE